jgi:hypothetical protein
MSLRCLFGKHAPLTSPPYFDRVEMRILDKTDHLVAQVQLCRRCHSLYGELGPVYRHGVASVQGVLALMDEMERKSERP